MNGSLISKSLLVAAALAYTGEARAATVTGTISHIQFDSAGSISVQLTGSPALCTNGHWLNTRGAVVAGVRGVTAEGLKTMYSTLMSAFLASKRITVYTDETVTTTGWGCTVYAIDIWAV